LAPATDAIGDISTKANNDLGNESAETARLEGHSNWVRGLCVLPDGRLASASYDNTIRLWYLITHSAGALTAASAPLIKDIRAT
jgi:WD40 repeat protein